MASRLGGQRHWQGGCGANIEWHTEDDLLPDIAPDTTLKNLVPDSHLYNVTLYHLTRGQNRVIWAKQVMMAVKQKKPTQSVGFSHASFTCL